MRSQYWYFKLDLNKCPHILQFVSLTPTPFSLARAGGFRQHLNWMPDMFLLSTFGLKCSFKVFESHICYLNSFCFLPSFVIIPIKILLCFGNFKTIFDDVLGLDLFGSSSQDGWVILLSQIFWEAWISARMLDFFFFFSPAHSIYQQTFLILDSNKVI